MNCFVDLFLHTRTHACARAYTHTHIHMHTHHFSWEWWSLSVLFWSHLKKIKSILRPKVHPTVRDHLQVCTPLSLFHIFIDVIGLMYEVRVCSYTKLWEFELSLLCRTKYRALFTRHTDPDWIRIDVSCTFVNSCYLDSNPDSNPHHEVGWPGFNPDYKCENHRVNSAAWVYPVKWLIPTRNRGKQCIQDLQLVMLLIHGCIHLHDTRVAVISSRFYTLYKQSLIRTQSGLQWIRIVSCKQGFGWFEQPY